MTYITVPLVALDQNDSKDVRPYKALSTTTYLVPKQSQLKQCCKG